MKNKYLWTALLLAILLGITCGTLHAYSVATHKAQKDTLSGRMTNRPIETITLEYEPIAQSQAVFEGVEKEVIEIIDDGIPAEVKEACEKYGAEYFICPELLESLAYQESRFIADVVSDDGSCIGVCQIKQSCHRSRMKRLGVTDLTDIEQNIHVAADYLSEILQEHEDIAECLYIFNGNQTGLKRYQETGEIKSAYVKEILERSMDYERLHGKRDF